VSSDKMEIECVLATRNGTGSFGGDCATGVKFGDFYSDSGRLQGSGTGNGMAPAPGGAAVRYEHVA
jgi:hypothetical protein